MRLTGVRERLGAKGPLRRVEVETSFGKAELVDKQCCRRGKLVAKQSCRNPELVTETS